MGKNTSGAVHLTSLDLDISKISENLDTIRNQISETADDIPRIWNSAIESGDTKDILEILGINDIPAAEKKIQELTDALGNYQKLELQSKGGELFKAIATQADESGIAIRKVIDLTKDLNEALSSATYTDTSPLVASKQAKKEEEEYYNASIQYRKNLSKEEQNATKVALEESGKRNQAREKEIESVRKLDEQSYSSTMKSQEDYLLSLEKYVSSLSSAYEKLGERVNKIGISDEMAQKFTRNIQTVLDKLATMQSDLSFSQVVPEGFENQLKTVQQVFNGLSKAIESARIEQEKFEKDTKEAYDNIKKGITSTISELKILEKSATFTNSRKEAGTLRAEFEKLYSEIKSGNVDLKTAESQFSSLESRFNSFKSTVQTGTTAFQNFVNKVSESAKWQVANQMLNMFQQAMGNVLSTITDTEDAVIELRRVLSDAPLASGISDELYQIAYDFGQTFDNVQETAVRFAQTGLDWQEVVDATRATMLGLNTAELDVSTATEGLIAVMAQFNIQAADLEEVIDKINTTADHFPVTSEKIVEALQRAGGTASAFGLTLEETIGIITALSEATGRAGANIGTAMNSLISFSMKDTALEKFSEFLGKDVSNYGVLQLWQELSEAIKTSGNELATMMSQQEGFSDLMDETLASSLGLEEEYTLALKEQNEAIAENRDIYSTVGTYRQNYFIALLNNIDTATEAIDGMGDALGYSLQENETAMSTFTKQWNQLVVSAQELAVQFGEAGFLEIVKGLTDAGTATLKFTKEIGGLRTALTALATVMIAVKSQKINEQFDKGREAIIKFFDRTDSGVTSTKGLIESLKNLKITFSGVVTAISLAVTAYSVYKAAVDKARQASIDAGKAAADEADDLLSAYSTYEKARIAYDGTTEASEKYTEASKALRDELEKQGVAVDNIATSYETATDKLKEYTEQELNRKIAEITASMEDAKEKFEDWADGFAGLGSREFFDLSDYESEEPPEIINVKNIEDGIQVYQQYGWVMDDIIEKMGAEAAGQNEVYRYAYKKRKELEEQISDYIEFEKDLEKLTKSQEEESKAVSNLTENYVDFHGQLYQVAEDGSLVLVSSQNQAEAIDTITSSLEDLKSAYDEISGSIDSFQSAYSTLLGVIDEYNETGNMTADMVQTILGLEPEYIELLDTSADSLSINEEKLQDLIKASDDRIEQLAAIKIAEEAATWAEQIKTIATQDMTEAEIIAALTTQALASDLENTALAFLNGEVSADDFKSALKEYATQCGLTGTAADALGKKVEELAGKMASTLYLFDRIPGEGDTVEIDPEDRHDYGSSRLPKYYTAPKSTSKSSSSTKDPFEEKLKAEKEALDDLIDSYEHQIFLMEKNKASAKDIAAVYKEMQSAVHEQAEKYRSMGVDEESEYIRDLQELWWSYQEEIEEVLNGIYEATVEAHQNAISLLENQYNKAVERMDYSEMSTNLQKQLDYQKKIQEEAHKEAERLRQLGVDENDDAIQACIDAWWEADDAIQEINSRIEESILDTYDDFIDLADEFDLWDYMDFTKVDYLKAKLEDINKLLKEGTISLKEYNTLLRQWNVDMFNAQKELLQKQQTAVQNQADAVVKGYEADITALEKRKDDVESYYDSVINGYEAEIKVWEKRKDEIEDYYDTLIDNLNEVQEANDRINAQIDYYNSRQKIITNLEQAQARSGVAWREKEMEYQQQLIDLDEDWNRTQQEWSIEDQIDQLEKLKEQATADIDATIEKIQQSIEDAEVASKAAVDAIDAEIAGIQDTITAVEEQAELEIQALEDQITSLSQQFAEAIKAGMSDGLIDSREEFDKAVEDGRDFLLSTLDDSSAVMEQNAEETATGVMDVYKTSFITPFSIAIDGIAAEMKDSIPSGAKAAAGSALSIFETSFISPLKSSIANLMSEVQKINISYSAKPASVSTTTTTSGRTSSYKNPLATGNLRTTSGAPTTVYISNYNSTTETAASRTQNILQQILH